MALANYKAVFRADFKPKLSFYTHMFDTAALLGGYKDWLTTGTAITLQDFEVRSSLSLTHSFFAYVRDMHPKENLDTDSKRIQEIINTVPEHVGIDMFERVGFRCWFLQSVEMRFDQLVFVVADKFLVQNKEIKERICPAPTDAAYTVHFADGKMTVALRTGPMKREEVEAQFLPDRNSNFAVRDRTLPSEELFKSVPEVAMLIDIDVSQKNVKREGLEKFAADAQGLQEQLSKNIVQYVFGLRGKEK
jgi:hypothetical protein